MAQTHKRKRPWESARRNESVDPFDSKDGCCSQTEEPEKRLLKPKHLEQSLKLHMRGNELTKPTFEGLGVDTKPGRYRATAQWVRGLSRRLPPCSTLPKRLSDLWAKVFKDLSPGCFQLLWRHALYPPLVLLFHLTHPVIGRLRYDIRRGGLIFHAVNVVCYRWSYGRRLLKLGGSLGFL